MNTCCSVYCIYVHIYITLYYVKCNVVLVEFFSYSAPHMSFFVLPLLSDLCHHHPAAIVERLTVHTVVAVKRTLAIHITSPANHQKQ